MGRFHSRLHSLSRNNYFLTLASKIRETEECDVNNKILFRFETIFNQTKESRLMMRLAMKEKGNKRKIFSSFNFLDFSLSFLAHFNFPIKRKSKERENKNEMLERIVCHKFDPHIKSLTETYHVTQH